MRAPTMCAFGDGAFDVDPERADVGIGPYGVRTAMVHPTRQLGTGGHIGRPYGKTGGGSVGADFISARAAPPRRTHLR